MSKPVSQEINNLQNGVSQQSPALRFRSQCEDQENCRNDPVEGMGKRPNTELVGSVPAIGTPSTSVIETVERDSVEKYKFIISNGAVRVLDAESGYEYPVSSSLSAQKYLKIRGDTAPVRAYQMLNTIDTTFILNKTVPVRRLKYTEDGFEPGPEHKRVAIVSVARHPLAEQFDPTFNYYSVFNVEGTQMTLEDHTLSSSALAAQLAEWIAEHNQDAETVYTKGHDVYVELPVGASLNVTGRWEALDERNSRPMGTSSLLTMVYYRQELPEGDGPVPAALWYIKQADYATTYTVTINGVACSHTTPDATSEQARSGLDTMSLTAKVQSAINAKSNEHGCNASQHGNVLYIKDAVGEDFTIKAHDDLGDRASFAVKEWANNMDEVPPNGIEGFHVEVRGDVEQTDVSPYHIVYTETASDGTKTAGIWKETRKQSADYRLDARTMPHALRRVQDPEAVTDENPLGIAFELVASEHAERSVGDDDTAPFPSFVSKQDKNGFIEAKRHIKSMIYHKNRLCYASDENLVFSETGEYMNFFPTTVVTTLDADPIDVAMNVNSVAPVEHMLKHAGELFLFAPSLQLMVRSGEIFSIDSLDITILSDYHTDMTCAPFVHEGTIHFWSKGDKYSTLYEYLPQGDTNRYKALPITPHVPRYVTGSVVKSLPVQAENMMFHLTRKESGQPVNHLYVTNVLMQGNERVQNAWQKWAFHGNLLDAAIIGSRLSLIIEKDGVLTLEDITLSHDPLKEEIGIPVLLDQRQEVDALFTLPDGDERVIFRNKGRSWTGYKYMQKYTFSQFFPRDREGQSITSGRLQLRYLTLAFNDTTGFKLSVDRGADVRYKSYEGVKVGSLQNAIGDIPLTSGTVRFPVHTKADRAVITIWNDSEQDALFHAAEWQGTYTRTTRRM